MITLEELRNLREVGSQEQMKHFKRALENEKFLKKIEDGMRNNAKNGHDNFCIDDVLDDTYIPELKLSMNDFLSDCDDKKYKIFRNEIVDFLKHRLPDFHIKAGIADELGNNVSINWKYKD